MQKRARYLPVQRTKYWQVHHEYYCLIQGRTISEPVTDTAGVVLKFKNKRGAKAWISARNGLLRIFPN